MNKVLSKMGLIVVIFFMAGMMISTAVAEENKISGTNDQIVDTSININTATVKELSGLTGIGKKRAEAIIAYRTNHGNFSEINDLRKVEGIGKKTFEKIKAEIAVN
jgi:competence protein ComEA